MDSRSVQHDGVIVAVEGSRVKVLIESRSACSECHAKGVCGAGESKEKIIDAISAEALSNGDAVTVYMEARMGWKAVLYGFILPFIVLMGLLFILRSLGAPEVVAAPAALAGLAPYYLILYLLRKRIEKEFVFKAEKKNK